MDKLSLLRDVFFYWAVLLLGGFLLGVLCGLFLGLGAASALGAIAVGASFAFGTLAFAVIARMNRAAGLRYLAVVAGVAWVSEVLLVPIGSSTLGGWLLHLPVTALAMLLGWRLGGWLPGSFEVPEPSRIGKPATFPAVPKPVVLLLAVLGGLGVLGYGWQQHVRKTAQAALAAEFRSIRLAGYPASLSDYEKPPLQATENAALVYQEAFELLRPPAPGEDQALDLILDPREARPPSPADVAAVEAFLADNAQALGLVRQASRMPACRFPCDVSRGLASLDMSHLEPLSRLWQLLAARITLEVQAETPDREQVLDDIETLFGMARAPDETPGILPHMIRLVLDSAALESLRRAVDGNALPSHGAEAVAARLETVTDRRRFATAVANERFLAIRTVEGLKEGALPQFEDLGDPRKLPAWARAHLDQNLLLYLQLMEPLVEAAAAPYWAPPEEDRPEIDFETLPSRYVLTRALYPNVAAIASRQARLDTTAAVARAAVALLRYRRAESRFPEDLADLVPRYLESAPLNAFTGKPIDYRVEEGRAELRGPEPDRSERSQPKPWIVR